jgi:pimeloyl-ACP methyl ester carboxylesterase
MALANNGGASVGEVLRLATQIVPTDFESVYNAFYYMAQQIHSIAESISVTVDPVAAREAYFRASSYYRGADFFLHGNQSDPRVYTLWDQQLASFNKAIALLKPVPGERFTVKAANSSVGPYEIPGIFFKASASNALTPTIMVGNGYDGSQEESYHMACVEILKRGVNCVTYEGPGQPTVRRNQNLGFIPDWWTAATPVVDYLSTRPDVDISRLALVGISFGGTLAPRAASHDHRYSAVVSLDGLYSLQEALEEQIPKEITQYFNPKNATIFDEILNSIRLNTSYPTDLRWIIDQGLFAFNTTSPYDWFARLGNITMGPDIVKDLPMPVFVAKGQDDNSTLQEPEEAYQLLLTDRPNGKNLTTYHVFSSALGAGEHCSLGTESQVWQVVMDWLSDVWGGVAYAEQPVRSLGDIIISYLSPKPDH